MSDRKYLPMYDQDCRQLRVAVELDNQTCAAVFPMFQNLIKEGYSPRDISHVILLSVMECEMSSLLGMNQDDIQTGKINPLIRED